MPDVTLRSLDRDERLAAVDGGDSFYCGLPDCDVVSFAADGRTLTKHALKVQVGAKEKIGPRTVCDCFGHTVESIREEVERTGRSSVAASIPRRSRQASAAARL